MRAIEAVGLTGILIAALLAASFSSASADDLDVALQPVDASSESGTWNSIWFPPSGRHFPTAIYDPMRTRMVVFGGLDGAYRNDVWTLSLWGVRPEWTELFPSATPPTGRYGHTAVYDPLRDRVVVFGGYCGTRQNDVWTLRLGGTPEWSQLTPSGTLPGARYLHSAIYDPARDRMVVFGGFDVGCLDDVWALSLGENPEWTRLTPAGDLPSARYLHSAIYDPIRDRMVVFGGYEYLNRYCNDTWTLSLGESPQWTLLQPTGSPPPARGAHTAVYDPVRDQMLIFGGGSGGNQNETWTLSLSGNPQWTLLEPSGDLPAPRSGHTAIYDPGYDRMVVFGGADGWTYRNDSWQLSLKGVPEWKQAAASFQSGRYAHTTIYDETRAHMVVFGGFDGAKQNDVWVHSLGGTPGWVKLTPTGTPPTARYAHTASYDPVRDRMVVFGGFDGANVNDVWVLSLGETPEWTELAPAGTPPSGRYGHTMIHDRLRDRMVIFGGADGGYRNDVWALSLGDAPEWTELNPIGEVPSGRCFHSALYDPVRDRMVVFGGYNGIHQNDVWALSLGGTPEWTMLPPTGTTPVARLGHSAVYDPDRDRMVVFGGADGSVYRHDTWALSLSGSQVWTELTPTGGPPAPRYGHTATMDPLHGRMVIFGGADGSSCRNDTWSLEWSPGTGIEPPVETPSATTALNPCYPNPFNPEVAIPFQLGRSEYVAVNIYDASGGLVRSVFSGLLPGGMHTAIWDARNDAGEGVASGVYFCRMRAGGFSATQKLVYLK